MVDLNSINNIYLYSSPVSFNYGIPSLTELILSYYNEKDIINSLFVFFGKNKFQIKIIEINSDGVWLYQKRLNNANFQFPKLEENITIDKQQLITILNEIKPKKMRNNIRKNQYYFFFYGIIIVYNIHQRGNNNVSRMGFKVSC